MRGVGYGTGDICGVRGMWCCERVWVRGVVPGGGVSLATVGDAIGGGVGCECCQARVEGATM